MLVVGRSSEAREVNRSKLTVKEKAGPSESRLLYIYVQSRVYPELQKFGGVSLQRRSRKQRLDLKTSVADISHAEERSQW